MSKAVIQPFEEYQKSRIMFVQTVAELAIRKQNIDALNSLGVIKLLGPLLSDPVTSVKQSAALAIGRLAKSNMEIAKAVIEEKSRIIPQLIESKDTNNKFFKKAACFVIAEVSKHSKELANKVCEENAIHFLITCLEEYDPSVKETAAWALGVIAKSSPVLAEKIVTEGAVDMLKNCLQEPEIEIKRYAVQTLSFIAKHSEHLTNSVTSRGDNLNVICYYLNSKDIELKRKIILCLAHMANNSTSVANSILEIIPQAIFLDCIRSVQDEYVQINTIGLLNEIAIKKMENAQKINTLIGFVHIVEFLNRNKAKEKGDARLAGLSLISNISEYSKELVESLMEVNVLKPLSEIIDNEENQKIKSLACKAIGHLASQTADIANKIARYDRLAQKLLVLYLHKHSGNELRDCSKKALDSVIQVCDKLDTLQPLLEGVKMEFNETLYEDVLIGLMKRLKDILSANKPERKDFIKKGGPLEKIMTLKGTYKRLVDEVKQFGEFYSNEIMNYYSKEYENQIIEKFLKEG